MRWHRLASARMAELERKLSIARQKKQAIEASLSANKEEQAQQLSEIIEGKTIKEWLVYYQWCEREISSRILQENSSINKGKKVLTIFSCSFFLLLIFASLFYFKPSLTGFITQEAEYPQLNIPLTLSNSQTFFLNISSKDLTHFKISGNFEGSGNAKVYLNNLLVFENSKSKKMYRNIFTGSAVSEANGETEITNEISQDASSENTEPATTEAIANNEPSQENTSESVGSDSENISENISEEMTENATETIIEENATQEQEEILSEIIEFTDACEETCSLTKQIKEPLLLRIEIEGLGALTIDSIDYKYAKKNLSISTIQSPAKIGEPVKWKKQIRSEIPLSLSIDLPEKAENISVKKISSQIARVRGISQIKDTEIKNFRVEKEQKAIIVKLDEPANEYEIEYETPAPFAFEENVSKFKKRVIVSSPEGISYQDVLSFTSISEELKLRDSNKIKIYWVENNSFVEFNASDSNNNGYIDYVEWNAPHLSNQTFEIILITKALHLDEKKNFISDIYESVKELDGIWSEQINSNEYVRVTFEKNLTSENDITIFPRIVSGAPKIKVFEIDKNSAIAEFGKLNENKYNKVFLTALQGSQDTFDLLVEDGSIEIDRIIDPPTGRVTLYLNNTATAGDCPTTSKKMGTTAPNSLVVTFPGEFDSGFPGTADAGQWRPGSNNIANTTSSVEIRSPTETSRTSASFEQGWLYDEDMTGYMISAGNFTFNLSIMGGQMVATNAAERIFARISVVNCSTIVTGNFNLVKDLSPTNIVGGTGSGGQAGWRANEGVRINHPGVSAVANVFFNISTNESHTFKSGEWLLIELGFGDGTSTTDRTIGLRYNIAQSYVITETISVAPSDNEYPQFSNFIETPANNTAYSPSATYRFNTTIISTNGTTKLDFNDINYTATNFSDNFTASINDLSAGTYNYYWNAFGNGTDALYNASSLRYYTIAKAQSNINLTLNDTEGNITINQGSTILLNGSLITGDSSARILLYNNGSLINNNTIEASNNTQFNELGLFNITLIYQESQNYTQSLKTYFVNVTAAANSAPLITFVTPISAQSIAEASTRAVQFNFTAYDADGAANLKTTGIANFTKTGETARVNSSCVQLNTFGTNYANYSCIIDLWYFDGNGTWNIGASVNDSSNTQGFNVSSTFVLQQTSAFVMSPSSLSFPLITPGATNTTANQFLLLNNTGNANITIIQVNATNLRGEQDNTKGIWANNFSVGNTSGAGAPECAATTPNTAEYTNINNALLPRGNFSVNNNNTGQEQLFICIKFAGNELSSQAYSTNQEGAWTIKILALAITAAGFRRKRRKVKLLEENYIPLSIFSSETGCLEALSKYLHENKKLKYSEIAQLLGRNDRTIWTACNSANKKIKQKFEIDENSIRIPLSALHKELTILEALVVYLKEKGARYSEIAKLLNRNQRNIWNIYANAKKKNA